MRRGWSQHGWFLHCLTWFTPLSLVLKPPTMCMCTGVMVQEGFHSLDSQGQPTRDRWRPASDWNARYPTEWSFLYSRQALGSMGGIRGWASA